MRSPREMGVADVDAFLSTLGNEQMAFASTRKQTLSAVLFVDRKVLDIALPWLNNIGRPQQTKHMLAARRRGRPIGAGATRWGGGAR